MKKTFRYFLFFSFLYLVIYLITTILQYTYNNFNFGVTIIINIVSMIIFIYFIDKFVDKLDKND